MTDPQPVEVKNIDPLPVEVVTAEGSASQVLAQKVSAEASVKASILRVEDQRRISGMWERTQQVIALSVVEVTLLVATVKALEPIFKDTPADVATAGVSFVFLASVSNLVIGFYFGRTNHQRVGGQVTPGEEDKTR